MVFACVSCNIFVLKVLELLALKRIVNIVLEAIFSLAVTVIEAIFSLIVVALKEVLIVLRANSSNLYAFLLLITK